MSAISMAGVFPPIPTPFNAAGEIDYTALKSNMERWNRFPLAGYVVLGSNGEMPYLSEAEKLAYFEAIRKLIPSGKLFLAGCAMESAHSSIAMAKKAAALGADVALFITPCYYKGQMSDEALEDYYTRVADGSPIPVSMYNMPLNTGVDMKPDLVVKMSHKHPNVVAVKDSSGNMAKLGQIIKAARPGFQVLAGSAGFLFPALCLGAVGGVLALANIAPQQCCDIFSLYEAGKIDDARELQLRMIAPNTAVTAGFGVPGLKAAMEMVGMYGGKPRSPMQPLSAPNREKLQGILKEAGII
jgi:4-hydroxy-2-oxoglutarate aldolase